MKHKLFYSGLLFILCGAIFVFLENAFYQYVDENGLLHESLFMPLGAIAVVIGLLLLFILSAMKLAKLIRTKFYGK